MLRRRTRHTLPGILATGRCASRPTFAWAKGPLQTATVDPHTSGLAVESPPLGASPHTSVSASGSLVAGAAGSRLPTPTAGGRFRTGRGTTMGPPLPHGPMLQQATGFAASGSPTP